MHFLSRWNNLFRDVLESSTSFKIKFRNLARTALVYLERMGQMQELPASIILSTLPCNTACAMQNVRGIDC